MALILYSSMALTASLPHWVVSVVDADYVAPSATGANLGDPECSDADDDDESS